MNKIFVNATEGTYGFHVVHKGWKKNIPYCCNLLTPSKMNKWLSVVHQIPNWIYSWMNPGNVKDDDEYTISKFLLEELISSSKPVLTAANGDVYLIARILKFLRCHVYTWETLCLHYLCKNICISTHHIHLHMNLLIMN